MDSATPLEKALLASPSPFQAVVESIGEQAWDLLNYCKLRARQIHAHSLVSNAMKIFIAFARIPWLSM